MHRKNVKLFKYLNKFRNLVQMKIVLGGNFDNILKVKSAKINNFNPVFVITSWNAL